MTSYLRMKHIDIQMIILCITTNYNGDLVDINNTKDVSHDFQYTSNMFGNIYVGGRRDIVTLSKHAGPKYVMTSTPQKYTMLDKFDMKYMTKKMIDDRIFDECINNTFIIGGISTFDAFLKDADLILVKQYDSHSSLSTVEGQHISKYLRGTDKPVIPPKCYVENYDENERRGYTISYYVRNIQENNDELRYLSLMRNIINTGNDRPDRTGTGTFSSFGEQMRFDISVSIPILTTKRVPWKHCVEELLWFLRGDTDSKHLEEKGVKIWAGNSSREFLDERGLVDLNEGDIGPSYGFQWRHFNATYYGSDADYDGQGIDQLTQVINTLKTDPFSRRIIMTAWNPSQLHEMALPPCHAFCQFYVKKLENCQLSLSCHLYQRSVDTFLGCPWNMMSYAILTKLIALKCGMVTNELIISTGDVHVYKNHIDQVKTQIGRDIRPPPMLLINPNVEYKDFSQINIDDFQLVGYYPHKAIKAKMAI